MKLKIKAGTTSRLVRVFVQDSSKTDGSGLTGLTSASSGLACYWARVGDTSATQLTLSAGTLGTWSSGGFVAVDGTNMPGVYELGLPNAMLASGSTCVHLILRGATNMVPVLVEIELDQVDYQDPVRYGLTALPNAAAGALGGLDLPGAEVGTAQAGGASTVTLRTGASATTDLYKGCVVRITGGTGAGQARVITGYNGGSRVATVDWAWTTIPDATSTYTVAYADGGALNSSLQVSTTASDPWATALPGVYASGTAGNIVGNVVANVWANGTRTLSSAANLTSTGGTVTVDANGRVQVQPGTATGQVNLTGGAVQVGSYVAGQDPYTLVAKAAMTEGYASKGAAPTLEQFAYMIWSALGDFGVVGTTITSRKIDATTPAMTWTIDSSTAPTTRSRAT